MSLIEKCDKCRRYYRVDEDFQFNKVQVFKNNKKLTWLLCDKCTNSLEDWMKGRILKR